MKNEKNQALRIIDEILDKKRGDGEIWPIARTVEIIERYEGLLSTMRKELNEAEAEGVVARYGSGEFESWHAV